MPSYTIAVQSDAWTGQADAFLARIARVDDLMDRLTDDVVLPILAKHYDASGIKQGGLRTGAFKSAITQRGAPGNVFSKTAGRLTVGVSYDQLPYARWVLEGRGPVRPVRAKVLHWIDPDSGKDVFAKSVGPAPAHPVYFLTGEELGQIEGALSAMLKDGK